MHDNVLIFTAPCYNLAGAKTFPPTPVPTNLNNNAGNMECYHIEITEAPRPSEKTTTSVYLARLNVVEGPYFGLR